MTQSLARTVSHFLTWSNTQSGISPGGGGGVAGFSFAGYVPLASQSPCPIIVYFVASFTPHLSHFCENVIFAIPTKSLSIYASTLFSTGRFVLCR